jgi:hypothetical protein
MPVFGTQSLYSMMLCRSTCCAAALEHNCSSPELCWPGLCTHLRMDITLLKADNVTASRPIHTPIGPANSSRRTTRHCGHKK